MMANHVFWRLMLLYTHLLLLLQPSVWWLSIVNFNNDANPPPNFARIWCTTNRTSARRVTPPWIVNLHGKIWPGWEGYPVCQTRLPAFAGHPIYHVNVITLKWEIIWTGGLPLLKRVTSPTWGAPPSCKQALNKAFCLIVTINVLYDTKRLQGKNGL